MTTMTEINLVTQVYQVFIKATPDEVWDAITKPEFTTRYFHGSRVESPFEPGARYESYSPDRSQLVQRQVGAHGKHQQGHAEGRDLVDRLAAGGEPGRVRPDHYPRHQVTHQ